MSRGGWPQAPVIYEIYPRSFQDSDGDGVGDLRGILRRLDHVAELGVDAVWIAPFFPSPLDDGGYDITHHCDVATRQGTLADFDAIVARAHELGLKVMVDQVHNHTSVAHHWFTQSRERQGGFDDWYVWADARPGGGLPNNWISYFGPPAWTWCHRRRQYYLHQFLACQPSLNLHCEAVQAAVKDILRFWCERGVDGFRFDAVTSYIHNPELTDNPPARSEVATRTAGPNFLPYALQDHVHDMLPGNGADFACLLRDWAGPDKWLLGENNSGNQSVEISAKFCGPEKLDACYTVDLPERGASAAVIAEMLQRMDRPGDVAWWLSSHDQSRHASAQGDGSARDAKLLALTMAVLPGPWLLYQGEELGLVQPPLQADELTDVFDRMYPDMPVGRTGARVPLPWYEDPPAWGFSAGDPWLPMRWQPGVSRAAQSDDPTSVLAFYRRLIAMRRERGLDRGHWREVAAEGGALRLDLEAADGGSYLAVLNLGRQSVALPDAVEGFEPVIASGGTGPTLPARTGALWRL